MPRPLLILILLAAAVLPSAARTDKLERARELAAEVPSVQQSPYRGYSWRLDEEGRLHNGAAPSGAYRISRLKFKNRKQEEYYWRTVRDVKLTLPYAKLIAETLVETYEYIETFPTPEGA